jgi:Tol biopolymer transport system component
MTTLQADGTKSISLAEMRLRVPRALFLVLALAFVLGACGGDEPPSGPNPNPQTGLIQVSTATTGADLDPDGYSAAMDGNSGRSIGLNGVITFTDVATGQHQVELTGLAPNCSVSGTNPVDVTVTDNATAQAAFAVTCVATSGSINITTVTTGSFLDQNGYIVIVPGLPTQSIGANDSVLIPNLPARDHVIELSDVAPNCPVSGANPLTVRVVGGDTVLAAFDLVCSPPPRGTLTFTSDRNGSFDIYTMDGIGRGIVQLTNSPEPEFSVAWSSDGTKLAFESTIGGDQEILVINSDGTGLINVSNALGLDYRFAWAPNSSLIAFNHREQSGDEEIYVVNADGTGLANLTQTPSDIEAFPTWSPTSTQIAFGVFSTSGTDIYVMNADGTGRINLTNSPTSSDVRPRWSPDGSRIAFESDRVGGSLDLFAMNPDGTGLAQVSSTTGDAFSARWSPNGTQIAFSVRDPSGDHIYVVNADGSNQLQLTTGAGGPVWSVDDTKIAYSTRQDGNWEVYTMNPDGTGKTNITRDPSDDVVGSWGP